MAKTVLFDLDGTIVDTNELIIQSFLHTFEGVANPPLTREKIVPHMGFALVDQLRFFSGRENVDNLDDLVEKYRAFNLGKHDELVREFPGVRETLAELQRRGVPMGIVTNKMRKTTLMGVKLCGLDPFIDTIVTIDDVSRGKPDPEPVRRAIELMGAKAEETFMVGDSQYDIIAGREAGVTTIAVSWSLKGESYLRQFQPDHIIHEMNDLLTIVG